MTPVDILVPVPLAFIVLSLLAPRRPGLILALAVPAMLVLAGWLVTLPADAVRAVGGWDPPLGILLRADGLARIMVPAAALTATLTGLSALREFHGDTAHGPARAETFWPLFYLIWAAANAAFLTTDLFNLYVALELAGLAAVAMVAMGSVQAALRYLLVALMGSAFYLLGVALVLNRYATVDVMLLADRAEADLVTVLALAAMSGGLAVKAALFPLHGWLPLAHVAAPAPASALLSGLVVKIAFVIAVRLWFEGFAPAASPAGLQVLGWLGMLAVIFGSLMAIRQEQLKPLVAYSTVAQIGYLFLAFPIVGAAADPANAWASMSLHAGAHMLAKAAMFLAAGVLIKAVNGGEIAGLGGCARAMPLTVAAFGLAAVSLMGLPPSGGFAAKFLMVDAALRLGAALEATVILLGGLLAAIYLFRPMAAMFAREGAPEPAPGTKAASAAAFSLALTAVLAGFAGGWLSEIAVIGAPFGTEASR